jgi:hypothetical protein
MMQLFLAIIYKQIEKSLHLNSFCEKSAFCCGTDNHRTVVCKFIYSRLIYELFVQIYLHFRHIYIRLLIRTPFINHFQVSAVIMTKEPEVVCH